MADPTDYAEGLVANTQAPSYTGAELGGPVDFFDVSDADQIERARLRAEADALRYETYHQRALDAQMRAQREKLERRVGDVVLHANQMDYLAYRWTANHSRAEGGAPYNISEYEVFDRNVGANSGIVPLRVVPNNYDKPADYDAYDPMRMNVAIVRNIIYNQYFPDGKYDPENPDDVKKADCLEEMGKFLGTGIKHGAFLTALPGVGGALSGAQGLPTNLANLEDRGALAMYDYLLRQQAGHMMLPINGLLGAPTHDWNLLPRERTALSDRSLEEFNNNTADIAEISTRLSEFLADRANLTLRIAKGLDVPSLRPEDMPEEKREISIQLARDILDKFRLQYKESQLGRDGVERPGGNEGKTYTQETVNLTDQLTALARVYENKVYFLLKQQGQLDAETAAQHNRAVETIGKLAWAMRNRVLTALFNDIKDPTANARMKQMIERFGVDADGRPVPKSWSTVDDAEKQPLAKLAGELMYSIEFMNARLHGQDRATDKNGLNLVKGNQFHEFTQAVAAIRQQHSIAAEMERAGHDPAHAPKVNAGMNAAQVQSASRQIAANRPSSKSGGAKASSTATTSTAFGKMPKLNVGMPQVGAMPQGSGAGTTSLGAPTAVTGMSNVGTGTAIRPPKTPGNPLGKPPKDVMGNRPGSAPKAKDGKFVAGDLTDPDNPDSPLNPNNRNNPNNPNARDKRGRTR